MTNLLQSVPGTCNESLYRVPYKNSKPDYCRNLKSGIDTKVVARLIVSMRIVISPEFQPNC